MANMRILHNIHSLDRKLGGTSVCVTNQCTFLSQIPVDTHLCTNIFTESNNISREYDSIHLHIHRNESNLYSHYIDFLYRNYLLNVARDHNIELIHDHGLWLSSNRYAFHISKKLNIPIVISPEGMLEHAALNVSRSKKKFYWKLIQARIINHCSALCASSSSEAETLIKLQTRKPVALIPHGINLPERFTTSPPRAHINKAIYIGRIHPIKGIERLLSAWSATQPANWSLEIYGPGDKNYLDKINKNIKALPAHLKVSLNSPIYAREKSEAFLNASLFIAPSHSENFGISIGEALSYAVPVITTKGTPWNELHKYNCGWWADNTTEGIRKAIDIATSKNALELKEMGLRGRTLIQDQFSWESSASKLFELYCHLVLKTKSPDFIYQ